MRNRYFLLTIATMFMIAIFGCSSVSNPVSQTGSPVVLAGFNNLPVGVTDMTSDGSSTGGIGALGLFQMHLDPSNLTGELTSLRNGSLEDVLEVVDITNFMRLAPCTDCARIRSVSLDADSHLVVSLGVKHPFPAGDPFKPISGKNRADLHVFNVEGVVISNSSGTTFPGIGKTTAGFRLVNADGYSPYLDGAIDEFYPTDANIHPYITHFDDYSAGNYNPSNPTGFESVTNPGPSGNLVMPMGCDYNYQDYVLDIPLDSSVDLIYAIECTYAVSAANKSMRFTPEFRVPQHNKKAASEVHVQIISNELAGGNSSSSATLQVSVVDINHGVAVGTALNEMRADSSVSAVTVEVPSVTAGPVSFATTPLSGTGHDPSDPLVFEGIITNASSAPEGIYTGLVKVSDSYSPGLNQSPLLSGQDGIKRVDPLLNPLAGLFAIDEFATYQLIIIDVASGTNITVTSPNGGEVWDAGSDHEITWTSSNIPGTVLIEYSKDNFVADINSIAVDVVNTGSYMWDNIPNDPSTTVKVRISSTDTPGINDNSDANFEIVGSAYNIVFSDEGILPEQVPGINFHDISPALCIETDGDIKMAYNSNNPVTYGGNAFSWACKSTDGLTWTGFWCPVSSWGGEWACHGDETKILPDRQGNSWRTIHLWSQTNHLWNTPFTPSTEGPYDGGIITTYIARAPEILQDVDGYIYLLGDKDNMLQFKKSEVPNLLSGGPSGSNWQMFPVYNIGQGYFSRARCAELAPNDKMYFTYYQNDTANVIKLAYNNDSTGLTWNTSPVIYDGSSTGTTGAHDPGMDIDPDGEFHVTFVRVSGSNNQLCYVHSDDGVTWTSPVVIADMATTINDDPICFYTVSGSDFLATIWQGGTHVYVSYSTDGGQTWARETQVDSLLSENIQPDFIVTSDGVMHIAWTAMNASNNYDIHYRNAWLEMN